LVARVSRELTTLLAARVKLLRRVTGWSVRELETRSGVARSLISKIEGGTHLPAIPTLVALAIAFNVDALEEMFGSALPSESAFVAGRVP
jgi:transcriptional regulator with XRE-family HTH domain